TRTPRRRGSIRKLGIASQNRQGSPNRKRATRPRQEIEPVEASAHVTLHLETQPPGQKFPLRGDLSQSLRRLAPLRDKARRTNHRSLPATPDAVWATRYPPHPGGVEARQVRPFLLRRSRRHPCSSRQACRARWGFSRNRRRVPQKTRPGRKAAPVRRPGRRQGEKCPRR